LHGGEDAKKGQNLLITAEGRIINLGGRNSYQAQRGDKIIIYSPGGGGYGKKKEQAAESESVITVVKTVHVTSSTTTIVSKGGSLAEYQAIQESA